jgi:hypothetical protein
MTETTDTADTPKSPAMEAAELAEKEANTRKIGPKRTKPQSKPGPRPCRIPPAKAQKEKSRSARASA